MTREQIFAVVDEALVGLCRVRITFRQGELNEVGHLLRMKRMGMIDWDESENTKIGELLHQAAQYSYEFYSLNAPTVTISFTYKFDEWLFMNRFGQAIADIEIVRNSLAY